MPPYAIQTCPGWDHQRTYDALGSPRCAQCGWSWHAHRSYGRPHPPSPPPEVDPDTHPDMAWLRDAEDEGDGRHPDMPRCAG